MLEATLPIEQETDFMEYISDLVNSGAIDVMLGLGQRIGLFAVLQDCPSATSEEIASAANYSERYVREWLAVMVTGKVVNYDPLRRTYELPQSHAACLTPNGSDGNLAVSAQFIGLLAEIQERLIDAFRRGDGIDYSEYRCFHQLMAEDSELTVVGGIEDVLRGLLPAMVTRLHAGVDVLDAGCGSGRALIKLAGMFPRSRFTGYDLCVDAVAAAQATADAAGLHNIIFAARDLSRWNESASFDLITSFDAIHDTRDPAGLLGAIARALRPGGVHLMQDIGGSAKLENDLDFPFAAFLYSLSCAPCTPVSLAQGGAGLGAMWGWETALDMLNSAGYAQVSRHVFPHDPMNMWFVSRKGEAQ